MLLAAVNSASHPESWASVQCLALTGTAPAPVVSKLITHLVDSKHGDKAADLLARCSAGTVSGLSIDYTFICTRTLEGILILSYGYVF